MSEISPESESPGEKGRLGSPREGLIRIARRVWVRGCDEGVVAAVQVMVKKRGGEAGEREKERRGEDGGEKQRRRRDPSWAVRLSSPSIQLLGQSPRLPKWEGKKLTSPTDSQELKWKMCARKFSKSAATRRTRTNLFSPRLTPSELPLHFLFCERLRYQRRCDVIPLLTLSMGLRKGKVRIPRR